MYQRVHCENQYSCFPPRRHIWLWRTRIKIQECDKPAMHVVCGMCVVNDIRSQYASDQMPVHVCSPADSCGYDLISRIKQPSHSMWNPGRIHSSRLPTTFVIPGPSPGPVYFLRASGPSVVPLSPRLSKQGLIVHRVGKGMDRTLAA